MRLPVQQEHCVVKIAVTRIRMLAMGLKIEAVSMSQKLNLYNLYFS
jgi:hypothetical protein